MFEDLDKMYELRAKAQADNLANRDLAPKVPTCQCGNMLTIADRFGKCTDCRRRGF